MKKIVLIAAAGLVFFSFYPAIQVSAKSTAYPATAAMSLQDRKEARQLRREERKDRRAAYKSNGYTGAGSKQDNARINRENYKQRKQMERASRKENGRKWGSNQNGDVFGVY